jgi:PII-like signaling protein
VLQPGPAKKVTIYLNESTRLHGRPLWAAVLELLQNKSVAGATVLRCNLGFGTHQAVNREDRPESPDSTIRIEFIDSAARLEEVLASLYDLVSDGLIEVQDTTVVKSARQGHHIQPREAHARQQAPSRMLRVYFGEADEWHGRPLHEALVDRLRSLGVSGATVHRGILGYGAKGHKHKERFLHISKDLPILLSVIDNEERIRAAAEAVEEMLGDGLIVLSDVDAVRLVRQTRPLGASQ